MNASHDTARSLYLELAAIGCNLRTGEIGEPAIKSLADIGRAERLLVRVRLHREALREALEQATASSRDGRLPVSVIHVQGRPYKDALCVMRLEDLTDYMQTAKGEERP